jgi:sirohydrochlorin ferrochelatase
LNFPSAYLLVFHGSRDPRPQKAAEELAALISKQLPPHSLVEIAALELAPIPLHQQIVNIAPQTHTLKIIPLFLLPGVHVTQDIPQAVEQARKVLPPSVNIELCPHLGSYPSLISLLGTQLSQFSFDGGILLAHGSRRSQSQQFTANIADKLGLITAYWSVEPYLETQMEKLVILGQKSLVILPYFLFAGGTTDAIAAKIPPLQKQFSQVQLFLGQPLGATPELAEIILKENHAIG